MDLPRPNAPQMPKKSVRAIFRGDDRYTFVRAVYEPGGTFGPHWQRAYQLVVLLEGSAEVEIDGRPLPLSKGEGILMQPGWRVMYHFDRERRSIHTGCQIVPGAFDRGERRTLTGITGVHPIPAAVHVLIGEGLASPAAPGDHLHAAMALIAKACLLRYASQVLEAASAGPPPHPALRRALELLEGDPTAFRTASELALRCGISDSRLRQLFQESERGSPSLMLWRLKAEQAVRMIRSTGLTLGEIAIQSGFANPFHLSRRVKQITGMSPRELRRIESGKARTVPGTRAFSR